MKHAYLIITHGEFEVLACLIKAIDDVRNDIFIHFDKKISSVPYLETQRAGLFILKNRIDVRWGDISVVKAEYALFHEAYYNEYIYDYYHLLSGVDMPLKSQNEIHNFFSIHSGYEFRGYSQGDILSHLKRKVQRFHLFPRSFRNGKGVCYIVKRILRALVLYFQRLFGITRNQRVVFKKGTQWVSVTHPFVAHLLANQESVFSMYHHTFCCDEIYKQTLCWNSFFRDRVYDLNNEEIGSLRKIGWRGNRLLEWQQKDYEELLNSQALFARKFSGEHIQVVYSLLNHIGTESVG